MITDALVLHKERKNTHCQTAIHESPGEASGKTIMGDTSSAWQD